MPGPQRSSVQTPAITQKTLHLSFLTWVIKLRYVLINIVFIIIQSVYTFFWDTLYMDIELDPGSGDIYYNPKTGYRSAERLYQKALDEGIPVT